MAHSFIVVDEKKEKCLYDFKFGIFIGDSMASMAVKGLGRLDNIVEEPFLSLCVCVCVCV